MKNYMFCLMKGIFWRFNLNIFSAKTATASTYLLLKN